jgi:hypothetical protein
MVIDRIGQRQTFQHAATSVATGIFARRGVE